MSVLLAPAVTKQFPLHENPGSGPGFFVYGLPKGKKNGERLFGKDGRDACSHEPVGQAGDAAGKAAGRKKEVGGYSVQVRTAP